MLANGPGNRRGRKGGEGGGTIIYVVHYIFCTAIFITLAKDFLNIQNIQCTVQDI